MPGCWLPRDQDRDKLRNHSEHQQIMTSLPGTQVVFAQENCQP